MALSESDTCCRNMVPRFRDAHLCDELYRTSEQVAFTDSRIIVSGQQEDAG